MDIDTQGRNSIMNSFHQSINGWMNFLRMQLIVKHLKSTTTAQKGRGKVTSKGSDSR